MKIWDKIKKNKSTNQDTSTEKKGQSTNQKQDQSFGEYENLKNRQYSRSSRNKNNGKITPVNRIILFLLIVMIIVPITVLAFYQNQQGLPEPKSTDQVMASKVENESEKASRESSESVSTSESIVESESLVTESSKLSAESSKQASISVQTSIEEASISESLAAESTATTSSEVEESSVVESSEEAVSSSSSSESSASSSSESSSSASGTYAVKPGDNLYRIAVNHGMSLNELLELNGLSANASIGPGTTLKVQQ